jgi:hypothetical protein
MYKDDRGDLKRRNFLCAILEILRGTLKGT